MPGGGGPAAERRLPLGHQRAAGTLCAAYVALRKSRVSSPEAPTRPPSARNLRLVAEPASRRSGSQYPAHLRHKRGAMSGLEPLTCSLRVIGHTLQGVAGACKSRISRRLSLLQVAGRCTVLRSRWYQSGIRSTCSPQFANSKKDISRLPLPPPPGRRIRPPRESSPYPCATLPPILLLPCPSARRKCERRPQRGSQCLLECPLFRARLVLLPTAVLPAPLSPVLRPSMRVPPSRPGRSDSSQCPTLG